MSPRVVHVTAGTGPVEVRRFVAQLAEHLAARCVEQGAVVSEVIARGDESAPASVEIHLSVAPDSIEALAGTHSLVARSPGRGKRSRKRWHAGVRIYDEVDVASRATRATSIERGDVTITAIRAGGPGGQHINKTASAVRVLHRASGITVRVSDERSQHDNVRVALLRLATIVAQKAEEEAAIKRSRRRLLHYRVERGRSAFVYETDRNGGLLLCETTCSS
jgi:peptide chain release factor